MNSTDTFFILVSGLNICVLFFSLGYEAGYRKRDREAFEERMRAISERKQ